MSILEDQESVRYETEAKMLYYLARRQLNLTKNKSKGDFEKYSSDEILVLLIEEIGELAKELKVNNINFQNARFELGDCAAILTGLIAWINKKEKLIK